MLKIISVCLLMFFSATAASSESATEDCALPAVRIISMAPHITETLFAIGAGEQVVGVMSHSDYPPEALNITRVGDFSRLDLEALVNLQPDLIIAWESGNSAADLDNLRALGLRIEMTEPGDLQALADLILRLGDLTGAQQQAQDVHTAFLAKLEALRQTYSRQTEVSVFYQFWNAPLMTVNDQHIINSVIGLCGGRNVFAELDTLAPQVSREAVLAANPQVILASGLDASRPEWLDDWQQWTNLTAVQQQNLFSVPPDLIQRHSPRILQGAEIICQQLQSAREKISPAP